MWKWLFTLALAIVILGVLTPWLRQRFPMGRLPGDLAFRYRGREYQFPFASTLLLSLLLILLTRWL